MKPHHALWIGAALAAPAHARKAPRPLPAPAATTAAPAAAEPAPAPASAALTGPPPVSFGVTEPSYELLLPDPDPPAAAGQREAAPDNADLDLASRVLSAAKQVTTVQEAPSIITVVTADEIRSRSYRNLSQVLATIPGWLDVQALGNLLSTPMVRGTGQAALLLRDGVSFFEPVLNAAQFGRALPLETLKRLEVVTGPGGVLWGANSFLGIVNVISKEAEDIDGLEAAAGYGDGTGSPQDFRAYVLFGKAFSLGKSRADRRLRIVQHLSFETFLPPRQSTLATLYRSPAPLPPGPTIYGAYMEGNPARSWLLNIDGRISYGPLTLSYAYPIGQMSGSLSFGNTLPAGPYQGMAQTGAPITNQITLLDRYLTLQYRKRFLRDRLGLDAKIYGIEFSRDIQAVSVTPSPALPAGLSFAAPVKSYRVGGTLDGDVSLPLRNRLLFGGEAFHEWVQEIPVHFPGADASRLPLACPLAGGSALGDGASYVPECPLPFVFGTNRTVLAAYVSDQFRPLRSLVLDGGLRVQAGLGDRPYTGGLAGSSVVLLGSASVVWNFYRDMHLKGNYATGFRPPVFNNTDSNGAAVQFGGNRSLPPERSQAFQGEVNARLLRNMGPIRELQLRADYSYTLLDNLIVISGGRYDGRTRRAIHSVEAAGRMYLKDHVISLGYTFLHMTTNDRGLLRSVPQQFATFGGVLSLLPRRLEANLTLYLISGYDDPNRFRGTTLPDGRTVASFADITFDRLPPQALLNVGLRLRLLPDKQGRDRLWASATVYNALDQRAYYPDVFYDLTPTLETTATPTPGWSLLFQVGGRPW